MPVVLSLALIGFIWQLMYSPDQGLINGSSGRTSTGRRPDINLWAVLVAAGWRHTGYIMLIYLAGLKGVDPACARPPRSTAPVRGRPSSAWSSRRCARSTSIVLVIAVIESLRAFDLVWVINKGRNGLELSSALVTNNVIGEARRSASDRPSP